jgi:phenylalanyl-tRNA synthetase beta chain
VELLNPISAERDVMRQSILASVLDNAALNLRNRDTVRLYEIGLTYVPQPGEALPKESRQLALVMTGRRSLASWDDPQGQKPPLLDFFDLKGVVESLLLGFHTPRAEFSSAKEVNWLHPGRSARITIQDQIVGFFGELHPKVAAHFDLADRSILVAEINLEALFSVVPERFAFTPVPRFPAALRDVAVLVDDSLANEAISKEILAAGGDLLKEVRLFDLYKGDTIPQGKKSLAYSLAYQADDRTLSEKEIEKAHKKIEDRLRHLLKAAIRGKDA